MSLAPLKPGSKSYIKQRQAASAFQEKQSAWIRVITPVADNDVQHIFLEEGDIEAKSKWLEKLDAQAQDPFAIPGLFGVPGGLHGMITTKQGVKATVADFHDGNVLYRRYFTLVIHKLGDLVRISIKEYIGPPPSVDE